MEEVGDENGNFRGFVSLAVIANQLGLEEEMETALAEFGTAVMVVGILTGVFDA